MVGLTIALALVLLSWPAGSEDPSPAAHFALLDGAKVHYESYGEGEQALVFVHGWTCDLGFWKRQLPAFSNRRVLLVDLPGHGQSEKPETPYTMDLFARGVHAVLEDAGVDKAVLVGHSMGTPVIRQFYRQFRQNTLALVIVDGSLRPFGSKSQSDAMVQQMQGGDFDKIVGGMIDGMLAPVKDKALRAEIKTVMSSTPKHVAVSAFAGMSDPALFKEDKIDVPVLAIMAKSAGWPADTEKFYLGLAPKLEFHWWQNVSHFLMMEKPDEFNDALSEFLQKNELLDG